MELGETPQGVVGAIQPVEASIPGREVNYTPMDKERLAELRKNWSPGLGGRFLALSRGEGQASDPRHPVELANPEASANYQTLNKASQAERRVSGTTAADWEARLKEWIRKTKDPFFQRVFAEGVVAEGEAQVEEVFTRVRSLFDENYRDVDIEKLISWVKKSYSSFDDLNKDFESLAQFCRIFGDHSGTAIAHLVAAELGKENDDRLNQMKERVNNLSEDEKELLGVVKTLEEEQDKGEKDLQDKGEERGEKRKNTSEEESSVMDYGDNISARSDIGRQREEQQDFTLVARGEYPQGIKSIAILADGHGDQGKRASRLGANVFKDKLIELLRIDSKADLKKAIGKAVSFSDEEISKKVTQGGTTLVAAIQMGDKVHIVNIGDSRAYHLHQGSLKQITEDHRWPEGGYRHGIALSRSLGDIDIKERSQGDLKSEPDQFDLSIEEGDYVILCSDGVTDVLTDDEIKALVEGKSPREATEAVISAAKSKPNLADNISVIVLKISND